MQNIDQHPKTAEVIVAEAYHRQRAEIDALKAENARLRADMAELIATDEAEACADAEQRRELKAENAKLREKLEHADTMVRAIDAATDLATARRRANAGLHGIQS